MIRLIKLVFDFVLKRRVAVAKPEPEPRGRMRAFCFTCLEFVEALIPGAAGAGGVWLNEALCTQCYSHHLTTPATLEMETKPR